MDRIKSHRLSQEQRCEVIEKITKVISGKPEILLAFLHGSFFHEPFFRDIDLGIYVQGIKFTDFWDYEYTLSRQIKDVLNASFPIETKIINEAPLSFCFNVIRGKLLLTRDEGFLVDYMVRITKTYLDMAPLRYYYMMEAME